VAEEAAVGVARRPRGGGIRVRVKERAKGVAVVEAAAAQR
jgi:hypothetical protein